MFSLTHCFLTRLFSSFLGFFFFFLFLISKTRHNRRSQTGLGRAAYLLLLAPHLQHFPVMVGVHLARESRATSGSILWQEPARLEPDPASVAQGLSPERTGSPLRGLLDAAMAAPPRGLGRGRAGLCCRFLLLLLRRRLDRVQILGRVGADEPSSRR